VANVTIFNAAGQQVKYLVKNKLCGTSGICICEGINENGMKADIGIYCIYFEAFNPKDAVKKIKKKAVLAGRL